MRQRSKYPEAERFIASFAPMISTACKRTKIFPSVAMAQAALETGWGRTAKYTLFGIKGRGPGGSIALPTHEIMGGRSWIATELFRAYSSYQEAIQDYVCLLTGDVRYQRTLQARGPAKQALELRRAGYATDPEYDRKLIDIIDDFDLYGLDEG